MKGLTPQDYMHGYCFKSVHSDTVNVLSPFLFCMQDTSKSVCGSLIKVNRTYMFSYASVYGLLLVTVLAIRTVT